MYRKTFGLIAWVSALGLGSAQAAALDNVLGFDPALLVGRTCLGVFSTSGSGERAMGATIARYEVRGNALGVHTWRQFGRQAYDKAAYAITQPNWSADPTGFEELDDSQELKINGTGANGFKTTLTYAAGGKLSGFVDPRPTLPYVASVQYVCR